MGNKTKIKKYEIVKKLLSERTDRFELAENPSLLCVVFWQHELKEYGYKLRGMSATELLKVYSENKLTPADTITRAKRRCLEVYPHLRDKMYSKRKGMIDKVIKDIKTWN